MAYQPGLLVWGSYITWLRAGGLVGLCCTLRSTRSSFARCKTWLREAYTWAPGPISVEQNTQQMSSAGC